MEEEVLEKYKVEVSKRGKYKEEVCVGVEGGPQSQKHVSPKMV